MKYKFLAMAVGAILLAAGGMQLARRFARPDAKAAQLASAVMRAQSSLAKFRARVERPLQNDRAFFIRVRFTEEAKGAEYLWLNRVRTAATGFKGMVAEPPFVLTQIKKGEEITVPPEDVVDWTIVHQDGTREGNFTQGLEPHGN